MSLENDLYHLTIDKMLYCWLVTIVYYRRCFVSRESSVDIATGYGLYCRGIGIPSPVVTRDFAVLHSVQTGSRAHISSYTTGTAGFSPGVKAARV
jgi:hypothetical protein